jgi:hypothetical protein
MAPNPIGLVAKELLDPKRKSRIAITDPIVQAPHFASLCDVENV